MRHLCNTINLYSDTSEMTHFTFYGNKDTFYRTLRLR